MMLFCAVLVVCGVDDGYALEGGGGIEPMETESE